MLEVSAAFLGVGKEREACKCCFFSSVFRFMGEMHDEKQIFIFLTSNWWFFF